MQGTWLTDRASVAPPRRHRPVAGCHL